MKQKHIVIDARIRRSSTGRYADKLLDYLQKLDKSNKYTVLLEQDDDWQPKNKNFTPLPCKYKKFSLSPLQQISFSRFIYKLKPDLVHFAMTGHQPLFYWGKQVTTTHDLTMFKFTRRGRLPKWLHWLRMKGYSLLMWQSHLLAKAIIVPSEYVRDAVAKFHLFTNRKIEITYEASDPPISDKPIQPESYTTGDYLLYVGSAFPHKNLRRLIKAFRQVKEADHPFLKLMIVGKKEYHARKLEKWTTMQDVAGVTFTGFVSEPELRWLYENAQAYVFPSLSEGFGLPGLEAMAHGCPVVSSNATCLPEIYGEAAEYFDPENVDDMAQAINKVLWDDKLRKNLIEKGKKQVKKYSWETMAQQTQDVYRKILEQ